MRQDQYCDEIAEWLVSCESVAPNREELVSGGIAVYLRENKLEITNCQDLSTSTDSVGAAEAPKPDLCDDCDADPCRVKLGTGKCRCACHSKARLAAPQSAPKPDRRKQAEKLILEIRERDYAELSERGAYYCVARKLAEEWLAAAPSVDQLEILRDALTKIMEFGYEHSFQIYAGTMARMAREALHKAELSQPKEKE